MKAVGRPPGKCCLSRQVYGSRAVLSRVCARAEECLYPHAAEEPTHRRYKRRPTRRARTCASGVDTPRDTDNRSRQQAGTNRARKDSARERASSCDATLPASQATQFPLPGAPSDATSGSPPPRRRGDHYVRSSRIHLLRVTSWRNAPAAWRRAADKPLTTSA